MARQRVTLRDQIMASAQAAMSKGSEHVALVAEIERNSKKHNEGKSTPDITTRQDNPAPQSGTTIQQDNPAGHHHNPAPQSGSSAPQSGRTIQQFGTTIRQDNPDGQSGTSIQQDGQAGQPGGTIQEDNPEGQSGTSIRCHTEVAVKLQSPSGARTSAQKILLAYFQKNGSHVANYSVIAGETGLAQNTVRDCINKFVALGWLAKTRWLRGSARGLKFNFTGPPRQDNPAGQSGMAIRCDDSPLQSGRTIQHFNPAGQSSTSNNPYKEKIDRENLSISLSAERVSLTWPNLARTGFGREQLDQITAALAELGKLTDKIVQSLDHAEWELERGQMLDKDGQPVSDPCSWVFTALARTGYYRRPKGYVSPEEQAAKDAEAEAKAVVVARQAAEQAQFEAWRDGLSPDELADALRGHPGGPKDAWLKRIWRDRRS